MTHVIEFLALPLCLAIVAAFAFGQANELDLKKSSISASRLKAVTGTGHGPGNSLDPPVRVSIIDYGLTNCRRGEVYLAIQLVNMTLQTMTLPWSPDGASVIVAGATSTVKYRDLAIAIFPIEPRDANGAWRQAYTSLVLYGNASVPGSEVLLQPGAVAVIRNLRVSAPGTDLCGEAFHVRASLSAIRLVKLDGEHKGDEYGMESKFVWGVESKSNRP